MDPVSQAIVEALENNQPAAVATVVKTRGASPRNPGAKMVVRPDGSIVGSIGGGEMEMRVVEVAKEVMRTGQPRYLDLTLSNEERGDPLICGGEMELFVEPLLTAPTLIIVGAGHIGAALAELGRFGGLRTVVLDDRAEMLSKERLPHVDEMRAGELVQELDKLDITPHTFVVIVTRAHTLDVDVLRALVTRSPAYIGMLGSKRRVLTVLETLKKEGIAEEALKRVHAPIGLEIHAETPQEIAVSIMAEIISVRRG